MEEVLTPDDFESYYRLREALDSLRDAALVQYALCASGTERKDFTSSVEGGVNEFLERVIHTPEHTKDWDDQSEKLIDKLAAQVGKCPPGFVERRGACVRLP